MIEQLGPVASHLVQVLMAQIPVLAGLAFLFTVLGLASSQACNPGQRWWRNPGLANDLSYKIGMDVLAPWLIVPATVLAHAAMTGLMSPEEVKDYFANGRGPLSGVGFWWQVAFYLLAGDFLSYWIHRIFHGAALWRFHAVHHSSLEVDWTSSYRFHPVNVAFGPYVTGLAMLMLGVSPEVIVFLVPFEIVMSTFVHANLNWTFGPLKYVIATPVFHRWHHGPADDGGSANFAPTFAFYDWLFGTFHMPEGRLPEKYGVDDPNFPQTMLGQLLYPFKPERRPEAATPAGPA